MFFVVLHLSLRYWQIFVKMFSTSNMDVVRQCQFCFGFSLPSVLWSNRAKNFDVKYATRGSSFVNYGTSVNWRLICMFCCSLSSIYMSSRVYVVSIKCLMDKDVYNPTYWTPFWLVIWRHNQVTRCEICVVSESHCVWNLLLRHWQLCEACMNITSIYFVVVYCVFFNSYLPVMVNKDVRNNCLKPH